MKLLLSHATGHLPDKILWSIILNVIIIVFVFIIIIIIMQAHSGISCLRAFEQNCPPGIVPQGGIDHSEFHWEIDITSRSLTIVWRLWLNFQSGKLYSRMWENQPTSVATNLLCDLMSRQNFNIWPQYAHFLTLMPTKSRWVNFRIGYLVGNPEVGLNEIIEIHPIGSLPSTILIVKLPHRQW